MCQSMAFFNQKTCGPRYTIGLLLGQQVLFRTKQNIGTFFLKNAWINTKCAMDYVRQC